MGRAPERVLGFRSAPLARGPTPDRVGRWGCRSSSCTMNPIMKAIVYPLVRLGNRADNRSTVGGRLPDMSSMRLTYEELGARLGISADAARHRAKRREREGRWTVVLGNED